MGSSVPSQRGPSRVGRPFELIALDGGSQSRVEAFLSRELGEHVRLGRVELAAGRAGAAMAGLARASAITFGGTIYLARDRGERLRATPDRALDVLGALLVHECVHIWQYRTGGMPAFLGKYLKDYFTSLLVLKSFTAHARIRAYRTIEAEQQAFDLEARWGREVESRSSARSSP